MTLGDYVLQLKGDLSYERIGEDIGMSPATIYKIAVGKTTQPTPDVLDKLAVYFGATDQEQRAIYAEMMRLAGYLERMPEPRRRLSDELLTNGVQALYASGNRPRTGLEGLDAADTEDEEQEA